MARANLQSKRQSLNYPAFSSLLTFKESKSSRPSFWMRWIRIQLLSCKGYLRTEQHLPAWAVQIRRTNRAGAFELDFAVLHQCPWTAHCNWLELKCHTLPGLISSWGSQGVLSGEAPGHRKTEGRISLCEVWRPGQGCVKARGIASLVCLQRLSSSKFWWHRHLFKH